MLLWPFKVAADPGDKPVIFATYKAEEKQISAEEISSMILIKMKDMAEKYLGTKIKNAVVTVPSYFDMYQCLCTSFIVSEAGFNCSFITEPAAAIIAHVMTQRISAPKRKGAHEKHVMIFSLGTGSLDVSIFSVIDLKIILKATVSDTRVGGEAFSARMVNHFVKEVFKRMRNQDISGDPITLSIVRNDCEEIKKALLVVDYVGMDSLNINFGLKLNRKKFEELNEDLFMKCMDSVQKCLEDAMMTRWDIDEVVLIGGSTQIPKIQQLLKERFHSTYLFEDEDVAKGAAILGSKLGGNEKFRDLLLLDITPDFLGLQLAANVYP